MYTCRSEVAEQPQELSSVPQDTMPGLKVLAYYTLLSSYQPTHSSDTQSTKGTGGGGMKSQGKNKTYLLCLLVDTSGYIDCL